MDLQAEQQRLQRQAELEMEAGVRRFTNDRHAASKLHVASTALKGLVEILGMHPQLMFDATLSGAFQVASAASEVVEDGV